MIRLISLVDNLSNTPKLGAQHGFSAYIETEKHKILFDLGQNDLFWKNAEKLGIDLTKVDTVVISHAHFDHGGGLPAFLKINSTAKIYLKNCPCGVQYTKVLGAYKYIGLDVSVLQNPQIVFTENELKIDDGLTVFSGVAPAPAVSVANESLYVKEVGKMIPDNFCHEQYLLIEDGDRQVLLTGCSHMGIANIMSRFNADYRNGDRLTVIGGFHLFDIARLLYEKDEVILALSENLKALGGNYYTCHCTGKKAYKKMKENMQEKLDYFGVGKEIVVE